MPFYDLRCTDCDKEFNIKASIKDKTDKNIKCPECGSYNMESVFKSANFYVKGIKNDKMPECPHSKVCGSGCPRHA